MVLEKIKSLLQMAIEAEENAYNLYSDMANVVDSQSSKKMLEELANDELEHKRILTEFKSGKREIRHGTDPVDIQLADSMEGKKLAPDSTPQEVITFAIKKEEEAWKFYSELNSKIFDPNLKEVLAKLAQQELGHKSKLEKEYEDNFMPEN